MTSTSYYDYFFDELADPRVKDWLFMKNPFALLTIVGSYLYFILSFGPRYMKNRKPYELTKVMVVYNFLQILLSLYILIDTLTSSWLGTYSWRCEPVDYSTSPHALRVARGVHIYHLAKITELLDTVFFVLRKKDNQISFLHLYHHTAMCIYTWGITKYIAGGQITLLAVLNSFVHVVMYLYYMLAAAGPQIQKYLWWKKYITTLQLVQFIIAFIHSFQIVYEDCGYPKAALLITLPNSILFFYLFLDFYLKSYKKKKTNQQKTVKAE